MTITPRDGQELYSHVSEGRVYALQFDHLHEMLICFSQLVGVEQVRLAEVLGIVAGNGRKQGVSWL